ncbi:MAG: DUF1449 family protein, partial [Armatimonadetes bacterium]|nr:DUF1449 family protein [Armatimonadota bacterium]
LLSLVGVAVGELFHFHLGAEPGAAAGPPVGGGHDFEGHSDFDVGHGDAPGHTIETEQDLELDGHAAGPGEVGSPVLMGLVYLGAGRVPIVMLVQILLLLWGVIGVVLHLCLAGWGPPALAVSLPVTGFLTILLTRGFSQVCGRFFHPHESNAVEEKELVGCSGTVIYEVTEEAGTIHVRDRFGTLHRVRARASRGQIPIGQEVLVVSYDVTGRFYVVEDSRLLPGVG